MSNEKPMTRTCKDCRWWGEQIAVYDSPPWKQGERVAYPIRECAHHAAHPVEPVASDHAIVSSGPDFGCIHFEAKP